MFKSHPIAKTRVSMLSLDDILYSIYNPLPEKAVPRSQFKIPSLGKNGYLESLNDGYNKLFGTTSQLPVKTNNLIESLCSGYDTLFKK